MDQKILTMAQDLQFIGQHTEGQLMVALTHMKLEDNTFVTSLKNNLKKISKNFNPPEKNPAVRNGVKKVTTKERFSIMLNQIKTNLPLYEANNEKISKFDFDFQIGENYWVYSNFEDVKKVHDKLIIAEREANLVKLITTYERARIYYYIKCKDGLTDAVLPYNNFEDNCRHLNISPKSAQRCLHFLSIVQEFPRLLICDLTFTAIVSMTKMLREYLKTDAKLADRLMEPLREVEICASGSSLVKADLIGNKEPEEDMLDEVLEPSSNVFTSANWELDDNYLTAEETYEYDDSDEKNEN